MISPTSLFRHSESVIRIFGCAFAVSSSLTIYAADWPQFQGLKRDGIADESEAAVTHSFPSAGPKLLWKKVLGTGFAGPVVAEGKVIVTHRIGDEVNVEALDPASGKGIWKFSYITDYRDSFGFDNGPRACPTVTDGKVIVHGAEGVVHALDLKTGVKLWSYDTVKELSSPQGYFGRASAPTAIFGNRVAVSAGGSNAKGAAGVIALNLEDGKPAWQSVDDESSYASFVYGVKEQFPALICWMRNDLAVVDASDGTVKFKQHLRSEMDASVNAATPIWCGPDKLFLSACYGVGASLWKWDASGKLTPIWQKEDALDCHYSTPVFLDGHLFGFHGRQEQGQTLRCIRAADGKVVWESERVHGGTLLLVKDTLVVLTESGELWLVEAKPDKFNQLASGQILRAGHRSYPAFSNGVLYARDGKEMVAVDLKN
jgi:outer membrane protein assembly factor BamB